MRAAEVKLIASMAFLTVLLTVSLVYVLGCWKVLRTAKDDEQERVGGVVR
jgi:hypothetical protein